MDILLSAQIEVLSRSLHWETSAMQFLLCSISGLTGHHSENFSKLSVWTLKCYLSFFEALIVLCLK